MFWNKTEDFMALAALRKGGCLKREEMLDLAIQQKVTERILAPSHRGRFRFIAFGWIEMVNVGPPKVT